MSTNYYDLLGVSKSDSTDTIKKAYRKMAMKYHPDRNPDNAEAEAKFKEVNKAWECLKDDQQRAAYDQYGHDAYENGGGAGFGGGGFGGGFEDIFSEFFGGGRGQQQRSPGVDGDDLSYQIEIDLKDSYFGCEKEIYIASSKCCDDCDGWGSSKKREGVKICSHCNGRGTVRVQQGFFATEQYCPQCRGEGFSITDTCGTCRGHGKKNIQKPISVKIPAGVRNGTKIRLSGEGHAGIRGGREGDLYLIVKLNHDKIFEIDGNNVQIDAPVDFITATLGGSIVVPTVEGKSIEITIPEGTKNNAIFRLRSKGMSILNSSDFGDMYVKVNIETPVDLNKKQKELLRKFGDSLAIKNNPKCKEFLADIKKIVK